MNLNTTLTTEESALSVGVAPGTLAVWRSQGRGPRFIRDGNRVLYRAKDVADYIAHTPVANRKFYQH